jgi:hypothetical protein
MVQHSPDASKVLKSYARLWAVLTILVVFILAVALILFGYSTSISPQLAGALRAIGESIAASLVLYTLISLFLDPRRQEAQASELAKYAITEANRQFQQRFEVSLPTAVYESSSVPKPEFRESLVKHLRSSTRYDHFGTTAHFASFRIARSIHHPEIAQLDQIRLSILDPRAGDTIRAHCELRLEGAPGDRFSEAVRQEVLRLREEICVTLIALYDIRYSVPTRVFLHSSLPFFRCEMFDSGMFLTYYIGGARFPEALEFSTPTRSYGAYKAAMILARRFATRVIQFGRVGPSADMIEDDNMMLELLADLGCSTTLDELRSKRDARFAELSKRVSAAGLNDASLF